MKWMKKPCANCPFNKVGAIHLAPGRVEGIIAHLLADDHHSFPCHKTVHCAKGGEWEEDENGDEVYRPSGNEALCPGSMIYLLKVGRPSIAMRMAFAFKWLDPRKLLNQSRNIIDPITEEPPCSSQ